MEIRKSDIVLSINGRDSGRHFFVIGSDDEYSILADGKHRRIEKPKRKKNKHLKFKARPVCRTALKLRNSEKVTNNELRRALAEYEFGSERAEKSSGQNPARDAQGSVREIEPARDAQGSVREDKPERDAHKKCVVEEGGM